MPPRAGAVLSYASSVQCPSGRRLALLTLSRAGGGSDRECVQLLRLHTQLTAKFAAGDSSDGAGNGGDGGGGGGGDSVDVDASSMAIEGAAVVSRVRGDMRALCTPHTAVPACSPVYVPLVPLCWSLCLCTCECRCGAWPGCSSGSTARRCGGSSKPASLLASLRWREPC